MTRTRFQELAIEMIVVCGSGLFLAWYIAAKLAAWPAGIYSF